MKGWFALLLAVTAIGAARADVKPAERELLPNRTKSMFKTLNDKAGIPLKPAPKNAIVGLEAQSSYGTLTILLPSGSDAKAVADGVDKALSGHEAEVEFGTTDEMEVVQANWSKANFGARTASQTIPIGAVCDAIQKSGYRTDGGVLVRKYVEIETTLPEGDPTDRNNLILLTKTTPADQIGLSAHISDMQMTGFIIFIVFVPMVALLSFLIAIIYGKAQRIPVEKRRKLFPMIVWRPLIGSMIIHAPFAIWSMTQGEQYVFGDIWTGSRSVIAIAMPALLLPLPLLMLMAIPVNKMEKKLFGPDPGEEVKPKFQLPEPTPEVKEKMETTARFEKRVRLSALVIGIAVMTSQFLPFVPDRFGRYFNLIGITISFFFPMAVIFLFQKFKPELRIDPTTDPRLDAVVAELAAKLNMKPPKATVIETVADIQGTATLKDISVTRVVMNEFTEDELRFLIAHELAHKKLGHVGMIKIFAGALLFTSPMTVMFIMRANGFTIPPNALMAIMAVPFAGLIFSFTLGKSLSKKREFEADRLALKVTGRLDAAISMFNKMQQNMELPYHAEVEEASTHPTHSRRIESLRKVAAELGLEPSPA